MASLNIPYKESQKFTQWWIWLILGAAFLAPFILSYDEIINGHFSENTHKSDLIIPLIITAIIIFLFLFLNLRTTIDDKKIYIHYFPLFKKEFEWSNIKTIKVVRYNFWQVGGWGIRMGTQYGMVYNIKGFYGMHIKLKDGRKYLIGTQKPETVKTLIKKFHTT